MFTLNMSDCHVWSINNYAEALRFHEKGKPLRNIPERHRIWGKETSKVMHSERRGDAIAFVYHSTDVVIWYPDDSYELDLRYTSRSTGIFANRFIPTGVYTLRECSVLQVKDTYHPAGTRLRIHADGRVEYPHHRPHFEIERIDAKVSRTLLKQTRYYEYLAWHKLMRAMLDSAPDTDDRGYSRIRLRGFVSADDAIRMLDDPDRWHDLMQSNYGAPADLRAALQRQFEWRGHAVFYTETRATLPSTMPFTSLGKWRVR